MRRVGVEHTWTNVGFGANARVCFPTRPPTDLRAEQRDVLVVDIHPITLEGFWGDCTRCAIIGDYPEAAQALRDIEALHHEILAKCRPGITANALDLGSILLGNAVPRLSLS